MKALEAERKAAKIGKALEAKVRIEFFVENEDWELLTKYMSSLKEMLNVSQVELAAVPTFGGFVSKENLQLSERNFRISVLPADGTKCARCWNYSTHVGENQQWPTVCERCVVALEANGVAGSLK